MWAGICGRSEVYTEPTSGTKYRLISYADIDVLTIAIRMVQK